MFIRNPTIVFVGFFLIILIILGEAFVLNQQKPTVIKKPELSQSYVSCLQNNSESYKKGLCLKDLAAYAASVSSVPEIDSTMQSIHDNQELQWCHEFMHYVGWSLYDKTTDLFTAFNLASGTCDSGMYHGIVERYIEKTSLDLDPQKFVESVKNACDDSLKNRVLPDAMKGLCVHGLGHGFMFITDNNLNKSLQYCDIVVGMEKACYSGAFMENVQSKQVGREGSHPSSFSFNSQSPDFPCSALDQQYQDFCYVYKGVSNVVLTQGDFKASFQQCLGVKAKYQERCFYGVGTDIPGPFWSASTAAQKCDAALDVDPRAYPQCILGGMTFLMQINLGNPRAAVEYCDAIKSDYKKNCYQAAGIAFKDWVSAQDSLSQKCSKFVDFLAQTACLEPKK